MSINKWAIQGVMEIDFFDLTNGNILAHLEDVKTNGIDFGGDTKYAVGGQGNVKIVGFDMNRSAKMDIKSATFDNSALSLQTGAISTGANKNVVYREVLPVTSNKVTLNKAPQGTAGSEIIGSIYVLNSDGTLNTTKAYTQMTGTVTTGKFTMATKTITFFTGDIPDGTNVVVYYNIATDATAQTIDLKTNVFSKTTKVVATGFARDCETGFDYKCQIIFWKAKVGNQFKLDLGADADPSVHELTLEALKQGKDLVELVIFDESKAS